MSDPTNTADLTAENAKLREAIEQATVTLAAARLALAAPQETSAAPDFAGMIPVDAECWTNVAEAVLVREAAEDPWWLRFDGSRAECGLSRDWPEDATSGGPLTRAEAIARLLAGWEARK